MYWAQTALLTRQASPIYLDCGIPSLDSAGPIPSQNASWPDWYPSASSRDNHLEFALVLARSILHWHQVPEYSRACVQCPWKFHHSRCWDLNKESWDPDPEQTYLSRAVCAWGYWDFSLLVTEYASTNYLQTLIHELHLMVCSLGIACQIGP